MIENKIDELIAALNANTEALNNASGAAAKDAGKKESAGDPLASLRENAIAAGADKAKVAKARTENGLLKLIAEAEAEAENKDESDDLDLGLDAEDEEPEVDIKAMKVALGDLLSKKGREAVLEVFSEVGVPNANEIKADDTATITKAYKLAQKKMGN